ncbi:MULTISPECIES: Zn-dependent hydrolase [unclassified Bacillus (in: firmicutes)]|uniref:Zn-dependent hydrolase n=1 Tax=unclassified Bacillus (in: firmicutes) TaxID=185979 RepID=UPI000BEF48B0|nr:MULTISPECIES: Zn-dependent hydrolase [unclassified Bacillus (in: firmicutes)]PEJ60535.1 Zn-dependent hydrolase [Bacillus sp. AFS002410]PEL09954.1 Zn-dependent hydrolase [Bacillus sp. AFS017336]
MINQDRLWNRLMELGAIGKRESGGITRLSFSEEERKAKDLVTTYMIEAGLNVYEDTVGNLVGRKEGNNPNAPVVLVGSHVDSVYNGGNFDGPLGVLSGIEILQTMNEQGITTEHPIEVIAFTDEEGARFSFGMIGSRGIAGTLKLEDLQNKDKQGITIAQAMTDAGYDPLLIEQSVRSNGSVKAYVELHIEQGKVLENSNLSVGIVTGIAGPLWLKFIIEGKAGHAGTTPMNDRNDALVAASQIIQLIEKESSKTGSTVGTVGQLQLFPGGINIIPGKVEFTLDLRDVNEEIRDQVENRILEGSQILCEQRGVGLQIEVLQRIKPSLCSNEIQDIAKLACEKTGVETLFLPSGAGHDCMQLTSLCPIGMLFIRSKDGISHNPAEWSSKEDCTDGANVLYHTVLQLSNNE